MDNENAEIVPPNFGLQRKLGGPASRALSPLAIERSQKALNEVKPPLNVEVARLMAELEHAVQNATPDARDIIWSNAHEIRGLAGTAGKKSLGEAADLMCRYLNGTEASFKTDRAVLSTIAIVAVQAMKDGADEDPMIRVLLIDGAQAIAVQRAREGRPPSD
jgi:hypothetical protein